MACLWPIRSSMCIRKVEGMGGQLQNTGIQWAFFSRLLVPTLESLAGSDWPCARTVPNHGLSAR